MITHWAKNSGLALIFDHLTWKSIGKLLLFRDNPYTKISIDQVKRSKDIEQKTQWTKNSELTLTFDYVT